MSEKSIEISIQAYYPAHVRFEASVAIDGQTYLIIYGKHANGDFCCVPSHGWGCEMAEPNDVFYNAQQMYEKCGISRDTATGIAHAIAKVCEKGMIKKC